MDIKERLAKVSFFEVKPDFSSLSLDERIAIKHCVNASNSMTDIYLEQVHPRNKKVYDELKRRSDSEGKDLLQYFLVNGSPWDAYHKDEPFLQGFGKKPDFGSFYPRNLTKEEWNSWLENHKKDVEKFESHYTMIKRKNKGLVSIPYSEEYREHLGDAAISLEEAALNLPQGNLKNFLTLRAKAFRTNDYFESDMAWVDTNGSPFEVTIGPYEVYFDGLLGLKASFESFIALPDKDATKALEKFSPEVPKFDEMLSQEFPFKPKGSAIPLEVVSDITRGGEANFGYMFVAYNLPNDRKVHDLKGSKKVFSRTMMEAKFSTMIEPIAERVLSPEDLDNCNFNNRLLFTLGHEIAHGLGPNKVKVGEREIPFETALGDLHTTIEEAKADCLGMKLLTHFRDKGLLEDKQLEGIFSSHLGGFFSGWRHGFKESHSEGHLIQYNWLKDSGAVSYDQKSKRCQINFDLCFERMSSLSTEFLNLQLSGNYEKTKEFMRSWGKIPEEIPEVMNRLLDIPKAVKPIWNLSELKE